MLGGGLENAPDAGGVGHIARVAERVLDDRGQAILSARAEGQPVARGGEGTRAGGADARTRTGDHDVAAHARTVRRGQAMASTMCRSWSSSVSDAMTTTTRRILSLPLATLQWLAA